MSYLRVLKYLVSEFDVNDEQKTAWYQHWIIQGFTALESQIKATPYCFGSQVTLADAYLTPQVCNALRFQTDMSTFPKMMAIYDSCNTLEAFDKAKPENQADSKGEF